MGRQSPRTKAARKSTASSITAGRTNAIDQMGGPLLRKFTQIEKSVNDIRAENLRYYYRIGQLCEEIRQSPDKYVGKDGTPGLRLVEQALSTQARTLRKAAMFAREYTEDQLNSLIGMVNEKTKFQLHWGHVSFLLTLPTPEKREQFAQEAVEKMLDAPALHELIKKKTSRGKSGHGRKHEMPKTVSAQIRQILTLSKAWLGKNNDVWNGEEESVFANILNMPVDDMEQEMVEQLNEIETLMQSITQAAETNVATVQRVREHLSQSLARREQTQTAEANEGRNTRHIETEADTPTPRRGGRRRAAAAT